MSATLDPVVEDMSITLLAGRVDSAAPALTQAEEAEQLGFKRVWIPERYTNKECGALLGGMAARTTRLGVGSGPYTISSRYPIVSAAMFATLQSMYGSNRITIGVGRGGPPNWYPKFGFTQTSYDELLDYAFILKQLLSGKRIEHLGAAGDFRGLEIADKTPGPPPEIWFFHMGGPKASKFAANPLFDGVALCNIVTAEAHAVSFETTRKEAERIGRDPKTLKFISPVTTAPDMNDDDTRTLIASRIVIYLKHPGIGERLRLLNGWGLEEANAIRNHPLFSSAITENIDFSFRREQLLEVARMVPEAWMRTTGAMGSSSECVKALQLYRDAGADEIDLYGSTPAQNANMIKLWRQRPQAKKSS